MNLQELIAGHRTLLPLVTTYRGALRRLRQGSLGHDASAHFNELSASNEAIRRLPRVERDRILGEIRGEIEARRRFAAGVARSHVRPARTLAQEAREFVLRQQRDTALSFPTALDGVTADGMISLALLRVHARAHLATATAGQLMTIYSDAMQRKDAFGLVEAEVIEALVTSGLRAKSNTDRQSLNDLREYVAGVQELRVPHTTPDVADLVAEVDRLDALADAIGLPVTDLRANPDAIGDFEAERDAATAAGQKPASDDLADYVKLAS